MIQNYALVNLAWIIPLVVLVGVLIEAFGRRHE